MCLMKERETNCPKTSHKMSVCISHLRMQIKALLTFLLTPVRRAKVKKDNKQDKWEV